MGRIRDAWQVLRGYAAAQDTRASTWAVSGGSATAEVGAAALTVARRARDAVRNDPYAARIVDLWTGNAVGAGITTRWPDKPHAEAWRRWSDSTACDAEGRLDLYGLQALVMLSVVESGECFVRLLPAVTPSNPIGLRLQVLESDHLDTARSGRGPVFPATGMVGSCRPSSLSSTSISRPARPTRSCPANGLARPIKAVGYAPPIGPSSNTSTSRSPTTCCV